MTNCYLCVLGGNTVPTTPGRPTASDGFGTCYTCDVHACALHGDKPFSQSVFRCADCWANLCLLATMDARVAPASAGRAGRGGASADRPAGGQQALNTDGEIRDFLARTGAPGLSALVPRLAGTVIGLDLGLEPERLRAAVGLTRRLLLGREENALVAWMQDRLADQRVAANALGWLEPGVEWPVDLPEWMARGPNIARLRLRFTLAGLGRSIRDSDLAVEPPSNVYDLTALAMLLAYRGRGTADLSGGLTSAQAFLSMPPLAIAIGIVLDRESA